MLIITFGVKIGNAYVIPSTWLALWNGASPLGLVFGAGVGAWLQDRIGCRLPLIARSCTAALAIAVCYISYLPSDIDGRSEAFLAGRIARVS